MDETAPFVSLKPEDDLWDESEPYEVQTSFEPAAVQHAARWRRVFSRRRITVTVLVAIAIGVLVAFILIIRKTKQHNTTARLCLTQDNTTATLCLTAYCVQSSSGRLAGIGGFISSCK